MGWPIHRDWTPHNWQICRLRRRSTTRPRTAPNRRSARLYNGMTQMSSVIIVTVKPSVEYAEVCMGMRLGNVRYSALCG
jgi:hypothetical protein